MNLYFTAHRNFHNEIMMMKHRTTLEFERDMKKLCKRFKTLREDLGRVQKNVVELCHVNGLCHNNIEIQTAGNTDDLIFYKIRKIASRSFLGKGSKTGLRVIYVFLPKLNEAVYLEIYFKGDKENGDRERIKEFIKQNEVS